MSWSIAREAWLDPAVWERSRSTFNDLLKDIKSDYVSDLEIGFLNLTGVKPAMEIIEICSDEEDGFEVHVKLGLDSTDHEPQATVSLSLALNQPTPMIISLPITARLLFRRIDVCLMFHVSGDDSVNLSIKKPYDLDWFIEVDMGDPSVHSLKRVTKVESFLYEQVHHFIETRLVYPAAIPLNK